MMNLFDRKEAEWTDEAQNAEPKCAAMAPIGGFVRLPLWEQIVAPEWNGVLAIVVR